MPFKDKSRYQSEEWKEYQRNYQRGWHQRHRAKRLTRMYERKRAIHATLFCENGDTHKLAVRGNASNRQFMRVTVDLIPAA